MINNTKDNKKKTDRMGKQNKMLYVAAAVAIVVVVIAGGWFSQKGNAKDLVAFRNTDVIDSSNGGNGEVIVTTENKVETDDSSDVAATLNEDGDVVIQVADITEKATFLSYDSNGTTIGIFAVRAKDGTVRTALNTCQVCNGSPKAYFVQEGDNFQCQNCGNLFKLDQIERQRGGCNPVPIMAENKIVTDTEIIIPADLLDSISDAFENWKKF